MTDLGLNALMSILISLACIAVSWWALQAFRFDVFLAKPGSPQAKMLHILLSIFIGHGVAKFLMEYLGASLLLPSLFQ